MNISNKKSTERMKKKKNKWKKKIFSAKTNKFSTMVLTGREQNI